MRWAAKCRWWKFPPFKHIDGEGSLEAKFLALKAGTANDDVKKWRDNPFQPHVVARGRPLAYMKWTVIQYIRLLVTYGDYYFRQNTLETVPLAIQCYVLASHIFGPRPQVIPKRGKTVPETYLSLLDKWDAFSNAIVEMELLFPFSNQTPLTVASSNGVVGLPNIGYTSMRGAASVPFALASRHASAFLVSLPTSRTVVMPHASQIFNS